MTQTNQGRRIHIHYHPPGGSPFAVEKEEGGHKRRFLHGITSGLETDGHGERMTEKCIKSFHEQANAGDIQLFAGNHGSPYTEDIGLLVDSQITPSREWATTYRLYDERDGMGQATVDMADKVWRQINGLPPYSKPATRGFSLEGDIPEGGLVHQDGQGRRVMDDVTLDGVWLVRRPSYRSSVAHAVAKALGLPIPGQVRKSLAEAVERAGSGSSRAYYDAYYRMQDALDSELQQIISEGNPEKRDLLLALFDEYGRMMTDLVLDNEGVILDGGVEELDPAQAYGPADFEASSTKRILDKIQRTLEGMRDARRG